MKNVSVLLFTFLLCACSGDAEREKRIQEAERQAHIEKMEKLRTERELEIARQRRDLELEKQSAQLNHEKFENELHRKLALEKANAFYSFAQPTIGFVASIGSLVALVITVIRWRDSIAERLSLKELKTMEFEHEEAMRRQQLSYNMQMETQKLIVSEILEKHFDKMTENERAKLIDNGFTLPPDRPNR